MTEAELVARLRAAGHAELASPSFENVDKATVLLDRLERGDRLSNAEWNWLADCALTDRVVSELLAETLLARRRLRNPLGRVLQLRPLLAAAAVLVVAVGVGVFHKTWPSSRMDLSAIQGWAMTDFGPLGSKGGASQVDPSNYEREAGRIRNDLSGVTDPRVLERAAKAALATGNGDDAERFAARWVDIRPDDAAALNALALAFLLNNKPTDAVRPLERARQLDPTSADTLVNLIVASARALRPADDVRSQLLKLKELAPTHRALPELEHWLKDYLE